ncbi:MULTISPECIES: rRNA maturation RNase YbeY [unclassified Halanaerobium]|uniref:rRNA maturation RNase YbeY n=1 Tax=unclassified Halanaerobium TaxID=2641197 RepID=UPI000E149C3A|nr:MULTISPECIES: rRNA maturation RNase YbeY [unclassified Halanaerobium]RCW45388.1 putative rRNA maturation factor [Halanaerobium sp. MA284_MarDTE_T2]RCW82566.1 putative rRNA maturation factor [Halanaerobium sp. DL-01]
MINIQLSNNQDKIKLPSEIENLLQKVVKCAAELEGYNGGEVSIALVDNEQIKELNIKYRDKHEATDVLSFPIGDEILGDIVISAERALQQAKDYGHSFAREIAYLTVHGVLHLFGYNHYGEEEKKMMRQKEERVLAQLDLRRN